MISLKFKSFCKLLFANILVLLATAIVIEILQGRAGPPGKSPAPPRLPLKNGISEDVDLQKVSAGKNATH